MTNIRYLSTAAHVNIWGSWLKGRRAALDLTQKELINRNQEDLSQIGPWERGKLPPVERLPSVAEAVESSLFDTASYHLGHRLGNTPYLDIILQGNFLPETALVISQTEKVMRANSLAVWAAACRGQRSNRQWADESGVPIVLIQRILKGEMAGLDALDKLGGVSGSGREEGLSRLLLDQAAEEFGHLHLDFHDIFQEAASRAEREIKRVQFSQAFPAGLKLWRETPRQQNPIPRTQREFGNRRFIALLEYGSVTESTLMRLIRLFHEPRQPILDDLLSRLILDRVTLKYGETSINVQDIFHEVTQLMRQHKFNRGDARNCFRNQLKNCRESQGQSPTNLVKAIGIPNAQYSKIELGSINASAENVIAFARQLNQSEIHFAGLETISRMVREFGSLKVNFAELFERSRNLSAIEVHRVQRLDSIGEALQALRGNFTQAQACNLLHFPQGTLSVLESGNIFPTLEKLKAYNHTFAPTLRSILPDLITRLIASRAVRQYGHLNLNFQSVFRGAAEQARHAIRFISVGNPIGELLRTQRGDLNQTEFAVEMGIEPHVYASLERGGVYDSAAFGLLARYIGVSFETFVQRSVASQIIHDYGWINLNLRELLENALSVLPSTLRPGFRIAPVPASVSPNAPPLTALKLRELIQERGVSLDNPIELTALAQRAGIEPHSFIELISLNSTLPNFLLAQHRLNSNLDPVQTLAAALEYKPEVLLGIVGNELGILTEIQDGRRQVQFVSYEGIGYDIKSHDQITGAVRLVEVKATSVDPRKFRFSEQEWNIASDSNYANNYWLKLILFPSSPDRIIVNFHNPARLPYSPNDDEVTIKYSEVLNMMDTQGYQVRRTPLGIVYDIE